ncbi:hypothetical protein R3P38DRAFT_2696078 [Favolaschia claudopus]|uniref:F-box domain-containing protein n=1 Tax=Favolaschia claudopus TaxID=2862362 RepID=A0AAW0CNH5_9AGAR
MTANIDELSALPRLPPELERKIFEQAALSCFQHIPTLMLTAWRVKLWLEPFLYRVVIDPELVDEVETAYADYPYIPDQTLLQKLRIYSSSSVGLYVRHILWDLSAQNSDDLLVALSLCVNVTDLFILGDPNTMLLPAINRLRNLSHLAIHVKSLCTSRSIDFASQTFSRLTHLELLGCDSDDFPDHDILVGLGAVPNLTHISFNVVYDAAAVHEQIRTHSNLQCIVFFEVGRAKHRPLSDDDRFVAVRQTRYITDWLHGATTGDDYWWLVERFIEAKRAGKVERSRYRIIDDEGSFLLIDHK